MNRPAPYAPIGASGGQAAVSPTCIAVIPAGIPRAARLRDPFAALSGYRLYRLGVNGGLLTPEACGVKRREILVIHGLAPPPALQAASIRNSATFTRAGAVAPRTERQPCRPVLMTDRRHRGRSSALSLHRPKPAT